MSEDWCESTEEQPDEEYVPEIIFVRGGTEDE